MQDLLFKKYINENELGKLIDFSSGNSSILGKDIPEKQLKGVAALYNILCVKDYAYLADEVGMGKTYQALGLATLIWHCKPDARILFIAPRENIQTKWIDDYLNFVNMNYRLKDDRVADSILKLPVHKPEFCHDVYDFVRKALNNDQKAFFLRLTSFSYLVYGFDMKEKVSGSNLIDKVSTRLDLPEARFDKIHDEFGRKMFDLDQSNLFVGSLLNSILPFFDLIVIDEAQNIRNNSNLRSTALASIFGLNIEFADTENLHIPSRQVKYGKVLLMSATPAHSCSEDIRRQLLYFERKENLTFCDEPKGMQEYMIRRFRRFQSQTKYQYRNEQPERIVPENTRDLLFLSLIQKKLSEVIGQNKNTYKIGFLEALESYSAKVEEQKETEDGQGCGDYTDESESEAPDKKVIMEICKSYSDFMRSRNSDYAHPPHPKHRRITEKARELLTSEKVDKLLVFVRRIASVDELRGRILRVYDELLFDRIRELFDITEQIEKEVLRHLEDILSQEPENRNQVDEGYGLENGQIVHGPARFPDERYIQTKDYEDNEDNDDSGNSEESDDEEDPSSTGYESQVLDFFASKVSAKSSAGGKFRRKFNANNSLAYFFEENYLKTLFTLERNADKGEYEKFIDNLINEHLVSIINHEIETNESNYLLKVSRGGDGSNRMKLKLSAVFSLINAVCLRYMTQEWDEFKKYEGIDSSLSIQWTESNLMSDCHTVYLKKERILELLKNRDSFWNSMLDHRDFTFLRYSGSMDMTKREVLKNWISKNLRMYDSIIDLAAAYCNGGSQFVSTFTRYLKTSDRYYVKKLMTRIRELINNYELILKQINTDENKNTAKLVDRDWDVFNTQAPVKGITGGSKVKVKPIRQFNTPFYPDIIVCTDVLKEGVDLHLFCDEVWHYGMAWTPGDIEQRTGRIDRYFCLVHRLLRKNISKKLNVKYPYVEYTIDKQQLHRVMLNKIMTQRKLDMGISTVTNKEVSTSYAESLDLESLFSQELPYSDGDPLSEKVHLIAPDEESLKIFPEKYPDQLDQFRTQLTKYVRRLQLDGWIYGSDPNVLIRVSNNDIALKLTLKIDKNKLIVVPFSESGYREQIIQAWIEFSEQGRTHVFRIISPIGQPPEERYFKKKEEKPELFRGVKLVSFDAKKNSSFQCCCVSDLLFFPQGNITNPITSYEEFKDAIFRTAVASDYLKRQIFREDRNFSNEVKEWSR